MKAQILAMSCLLMGLDAAAQTALPYYRDIDATNVNAQTRRTELIFYPSEKDALTLPFEKSPFYVDLNGTWDFLYFGSEKEIPAELSGWGKIKVPGNWEFQGHGTPVYVNIMYDFATENPQPPIIPEEDPVGIYKRSFTVPRAWKGREVYLNICGAKSGVYTYVNGKEVGYSEDSKNLARFDITPFLKEGENELMLKCYRWSSGSYLECQDFWRVSGIERDVYLSSEQVKDDFDIDIVSTLDESFTDGIFSLVTTSGIPSYYKLLDRDGKTVAEGPAGVDGLVVPNVRKWTAETPELYTLLLKVGEEYTRFDVGFRRFDLEGNIFRINGMPVKFKGVNLHEHNEFTGHYCDREYIRKNLRRMRELNINAIRTCHYPQSRAFYELCDSLGFYVYDEANVESHGMGYKERTLAKDPAWYAKHLDRNLNMYRRTKNYPCVTILSLGNEAGNGENFVKIYDVLKELEAKGMNRPVVYERAEGGYNTDFLNPMYPDTRWLLRMGKLPSEKPVVLCEYAHAMGNSTGSFDYMWQAFYSYPNLQGGFIWDWIDQGIVRTDNKGRNWWAYGGDYGDPEKDPKGWWQDRNFCCNGLVNPDLDIHPGAWEVKYWYQEADIRFADAADSLVMNTFNLFNRHYFKALDNDLLWEITEDGKTVASGSRHFNNAPLAEEDFSVDLPEMDPLKTYYINFKLINPEATDLLQAGYPIATEQLLLRHADKKGATPGRYRVKAGARGNLITLKGRGAKLVFDTESGRVVQYRRGLKNIILKEFGLKPEFWRAPNDNEWGNHGPERRYGAWKDSLTVASADVQTDALGGAVLVTYLLPEGCTMDVAYNLVEGGALKIDAAFHGGTDHVDIPRIGFRTRMKAGNNAFTYFGRGPQENYCDRFSAYPVGIYSSTAESECYPYVRPQETGHHTGVEWLEIGPVCITGDKPFEFNALRCSIEDLDPYGADGCRIWGHINDIPVRDYVELCIDGAMTGVGGYDSWGSRPEPDRTVWADKDYEFSITLGRK